MINSIPRYRFAFNSHLNLRYFTVSYALTSQFKTGYVDKLQETHKRYTQAFEDQGNLIFGAWSSDGEDAYMIFHTQDERIPYDFIHNDPIFKEKLVVNYKLKEIELKTKTQSTQLAQLNKFR